jgi:hypothetical protein
MRRIEIQERMSPILSMIAVSGAIVTVATTYIIPTMALATAGFRPDRDPQLQSLLLDFAWMGLLYPSPPYMVQPIAFGWCILSDRNSKPLFPRWFGWTTLVLAALNLPGVTVPFFKTGPLAWNGAVTWWMLLIVGLGWWGLFLVMITRAILKDVPYPYDMTVVKPAAQTS